MVKLLLGHTKLLAERFRAPIIPDIYKFKGGLIQFSLYLLI